MEASFGSNLDASSPPHTHPPQQQPYGGQGAQPPSPQPLYQLPLPPHQLQYHPQFVQQPFYAPTPSPQTHFDPQYAQFLQQRFGGNFGFSPPPMLPPGLQMDAMYAYMRYQQMQQQQPPPHPYQQPALYQQFPPLQQHQQRNYRTRGRARGNTQGPRASGSSSLPPPLAPPSTPTHPTLRADHHQSQSTSPLPPTASSQHTPPLEPHIGEVYPDNHQQDRISPLPPPSPHTRPTRTKRLMATMREAKVAQSMTTTSPMRPRLNEQLASTSGLTTM